jgi:hypothetical protein
MTRRKWAFDYAKDFKIQRIQIRHGRCSSRPQSRWAPSVRPKEYKAMNRIKDPFYNPFHNRFHVPVHSRLDEMQAYTHMVWLNTPAPSDEDGEKNRHSRNWVPALAGAFALVLVVVFSAAFLFN